MRSRRSERDWCSWRRATRFAARTACLSVCGALLMPRPAAADPAPASTAAASGPATEAVAAPVATEVGRARAAYVAGTDLVRAARWAEALTSFEISWKLLPHPATAYNIAFCERALGHYTRARKMFAKALADNATHGGTELPEDTAAAATSYLEEVQRFLSSVDVVVEPRDVPVALSVDGRPLEVGASDGTKIVLVAGTAEPGPAQALPAAAFTLVLDAGTHVFVVSAPGRTDTARTASFLPGSDSLRLTAGAPTPTPQRPEERPALIPNPPPAPDSSTEPEAAPRRRSHTAAFIVLGAGAAGVAAGAVLGGLAISKKADLDGRCPGGHCPPEAQSDYDATGRLADGATVAFAVGGAALGAGTLLLLWPSGSASTSTPSVEARLGPMGISVRGSFE